MSRNRDWCKVFESRTVADASYSGWRPATVAGVNQGYETSAIVRDVSHGYFSGDNQCVT